MTLTPKENYLRVLRGEIPEYVPSYFNPYVGPVQDELLSPINLPNGKPIVTGIGVTFVASPELNFAAMPKPGKVVVGDIIKWRDQLKIRDVSGRDWEGYYKKLQYGFDRKTMCLSVDGGDYFLNLVGLMGFENAMLAIHEEPEEVKALLTEISKFLLMVAKKQMQYLKPDIYYLMDDDAAYRAPFFSVKTYKEIFKPFHKLHCDLALESGCMLVRHDCGKSEQFLEDWLELGIHSWEPFQITNDCKGIKQKHGHRLTLEGGWDSQGKYSSENYTDDELYANLDEYLATFAPGGRWTFCAMVGGIPIPGKEPSSKSELVRKYYEDKVRYYYQNH